MSTPAVTPVCACPMDSDTLILAKIQWNLNNLFAKMSAGKWTGKFVNLNDCKCSDSLILAEICNAIVSFFAWFSANGANNVQAGVVDLASGAASAAIVFATPFAAPPSVVCILAAPDNTGFVVSAGEDGGSVIATGFTAMFGAATPDVGWKLFWMATPRTQ